MDIQGKIIQKFPVQTGTSSRGAWSKQEFLLEYQERNFPVKLCANVFGEEKIRDLDKYQVGDMVKVSINLSSREYNGRWYTDVGVWRIEPFGQQPVQPPHQSPTVQQDVPPPTMDDMVDEDDDGDFPF